MYRYVDVCRVDTEFFTDEQINKNVPSETENEGSAKGPDQQAEVANMAPQFDEGERVGGRNNEKRSSNRRRRRRKVTCLYDKTSAHTQSMCQLTMCSV